jgi:RNA polymerase sigma-70 factor (ECF subfamily)
VSRAARGDGIAFSELVNRHYRRAVRIAYGLLKDRDEAEDVAQEAFVQAYVKLATFAGDSAFYTWLYRIAMNLSLSQRRKRRPVASVDVAKERAGEEPMDPGQAPEEGLLQQERVELVQQALLRLGDEHRQILVLREMESCSYDQIGEILEFTVRSRLFRARLQLKEQLEAMLPDEMSERR